MWARSFSVVQEGDPVHNRHVPVEQDGRRHFFLAGIQRFKAVIGFNHFELKVLENAAGHLADNAAVIDDEAGFHLLLLP